MRRTGFRVARLIDGASASSVEPETMSESAARTCQAARPAGSFGHPVVSLVRSPYSGTLVGVTTSASALKTVGAGFALPTGMSVFTITTMTAFLSGR